MLYFSDGHTHDVTSTYIMVLMPTCDLYLRLSDLRTEDPNDTSDELFDKRTAKLRSFASALGWTVHRVIVENDLTRPGANGKVRPASAFKRRKIKTPSGRVELRVVRPGYREVLDDITTGRVNGLIAEDLDRAVRDPRDLEDLLEACEITGASARSLSGSLSLTDGGTEAERSMARVMVAMANKSSADTARRVAEGRERHWGESYQGGPRPFGYIPAADSPKHHRRLLIVDDEADIIRGAAADLLERGVSLKAVVRQLREDNVPTARGGEWTCQSLRQLLTKPAVAGLSVYKGQEKPAPWPAILERDVWDRLCDRLNNPAPPGHSTEPRYLLSGIAQCGICADGTTVKVNWSGARCDQKGYRCAKAAHMHRNREMVDALIEERIVGYLDAHVGDIKPPTRKGIDLSKLRAEARKLRGRKAAQIRMHMAGDLTDDELKTGLRECRDRLSVIEAQIHAHTEPDPLPEFREGRPAGAVWESMSLPRKRTIARLLMDVTLMPTTRRGRGVFDADAVVIRWKLSG